MESDYTGDSGRTSPVSGTASGTASGRQSPAFSSQIGQPTRSSSTRRTSFLSRLSPIPHFPEYTGPYKVGTADVEIPVSELESPADAPDNSAEIETVQFRLFYPCEPDAKGKRITWLPNPQRDHLSAYIKFLGAGPILAEAASFLPRHLHYTTIPVIKNAPVLAPQTTNGRWPTVIFSHGLGGSRNAYSQIVGSLASHGTIVICPEHRDGSAVTAFVRIPSAQNKFFTRSTRRTIPYKRIPHDTSEEVHELRNQQLRIRLWELGLIHEAIIGIDDGQKLTNLNKTTPSLDQFVSRLHVKDPGSIIFAGHSFGAATIVQFLKSVYYSGRPELETMKTPLYNPNWESSICRQVTPQNITLLLDMWCFPLSAESTKPLFNLPLPVYDAPNPSPTGNPLLAVESEDFYKWREHLQVTARILSSNPSASIVAATEDGNRPHFFYVERAAHLSQSDFALLFPWLTSKVFGSEAPERALRLNIRALLQVLRINGVTVAATRREDMVDDIGHAKQSGEDLVCSNDTRILEHEGNSIRDKEKDKDGLVRAWKWLDIVGMGENIAREGKGKKDENLKLAEKGEPEMATVIEPGASAQSDSSLVINEGVASTSERPV